LVSHTGPAEETVIPVFTKFFVDTAAAVDDVIAAATFEDDVPPAGVEGVISISADQGVIPAITVDDSSNGVVEVAGNGVISHAAVNDFDVAADVVPFAGLSVVGYTIDSDVQILLACGIIDGVDSSPAVEINETGGYRRRS